MTRDEIVQLASRLWSEELRQRQWKFAKAIRSIHEACAARGVQGGPQVSLVLEASLAEIRLRAIMISDVIKTIVLDTRCQFDGPTLRSIHGDVRNYVYKDIDGAYEDVLNIVGASTKQRNEAMLNLAHREVAAIDQQEAQMDLLALAIASGTAAPGSVNIHGDVYGAVQTGQASTAMVTFNADPEVTNQLIEAVATLKRELASQQGADSASALAADLANEAAAARPNRSRLQSVFAALSTTIDLLANAPAAWQVVRLAAASMGITS